MGCQFHPHAAMVWALHLLILCSVFAQFAAATSHGGSGECLESERLNLLQFKRALESMDDTFHALPFWNNESNPNCCKWTGVSCNNVANHVVALSLGDSGLIRNSSVPPWQALSAISKLRMLHSLDLSGNDQLNISIPADIGALHNLVLLNLSRISLYSGIMYIGNLSSLKALDVSYVSAGNMMFPSKALASLSNLEDLRLDSLSLRISTDWANCLCKLQRLKILSMYDSDIRGPMPACLKNLTSLAHLSLDFNDFFGAPIFNIISNLSSLVYLSAAYANISDFIPTDPGPVFPRSISYVDLNNNHLQGRFPMSSICLLTSLEYMDLSSNTLQGIIPSCIGNLTKLNTMLINDNRFQGSIPPSIGNLTQLNTMLLNNNQFEGSIPSSISLLTNLIDMDLSSNLLNGTFSLSLLKNCTGLRGLSLSSNLLTVKSSQSWSSLMRLEYLYLNSCNMKGGFPSFVIHHPSLIALAVSKNHLIGDIPSWIWKFENLTELDLSFNNFTGPIPSDIRSLKSLEFLDLSKNKFHGLLPHYFPSATSEIILSHNLFNGSLSFIGHLTSNTYIGGFLNINVAGNNISGFVPWSDIVMLNPQILDLSRNNLQGELTPLEQLNSWWGTRILLSVLSLNSNHFRGAITNLQNFSNLQILDLGKNNIHGPVPKWIGKICDLRVLFLSSNNLKGQVPQGLLMLEKLQILDISSNKLSGSLPTSFSKLKAMAFQGYDTEQLEEFHYGSAYFGVQGYYYYDLNATSEVGINNKGIIYAYNQNGITLMKCLDVSNNQLTDDIPDDIGSLKGLIILNMSYNHFGGRIPKSLALISQLDALDLSNNYLSGEIPPELASLSMLGDLNLSHNNLTGKIPNQGQLTTFSASSFTGNPGLCGFPIGKACPQQNKSTSVNLKRMHSRHHLHYLLFWLACGLSFGFGFAAVIIVMAFTAFGKTCFAIFDSIIYSIHFYILLMLARIQALF